MSVTQIVEQLNLEQLALLHAELLAKQWNAYVRGEHPDFLAYFFLEDELHSQTRVNFLDLIDAQDTLPVRQSAVVKRVGQSVLKALSNVRDDGQPFDVMYTGELSAS